MTFRESILAALAGLLGLWLLMSSVENGSLRSQMAAIDAAVEQERIDYVKRLSTATDSILVASREYDAVRAERDVLSDRLRKQVGSRAAGDSPGACVARVADLERMVADLHGLVEKCDNGWHGCASRKDALTEIVKP